MKILSATRNPKLKKWIVTYQVKNEIAQTISKDLGQALRLAHLFQ